MSYLPFYEFIESVCIFFAVHSGIKTAQDKINSSSQKLEKAQRELDKKVWSIANLILLDILLTD